ncbi:hypothetical protein HanPI659440_Chr09g0342421 [Helianthus annuus]|nr:hypothetical protein HanPI659440_Chr09g0342421 [Helianthus annuus]
MDHSPPKPSVMLEDQPAGHCNMQMKQKLQNGAEIIKSDQFRSDKEDDISVEIIKYTPVSRPFDIQLTP